MSSNPDPFDKVLSNLGITLPEKSISSTYSVPPWGGEVGVDFQEVPCRLRVRGANHTSFIALADCSEVPEDTVLKWVQGVIVVVHNSFSHVAGIRPFDLILEQDGNVTHDTPGETIHDARPGAYPSPYRIPPVSIADLPLEERVQRTEKFALGGLLYEILTRYKPFETSSSETIQRYYKDVEFPNIQSLPLQPLIYACWSAEFGKYIAQGKFRKYVQDHPVQFGFQVAGAVVGLVTLLAFPIMGAVGFSAVGPVAGSAAAGWQASIGAVQAGSLFAFCQSAAMGGAAATTLIATGATGGATAAAALAATGFKDPQQLQKQFKKRFRRGWTYARRVRICTGAKL